jgi:hypothetical protein
MSDTAAHAIRRSRHNGDTHEIVCRCGFVASGPKKKADTDFDTHVRIQKLRQNTPVVARGLAGRLSQLARRIGAGVAGRLG